MLFPCNAAIIIGEGFDPVPSAREAASVTVQVAADPPAGVPVGHVMAAGEEAPAGLGVKADGLAAAGFTARPGTTLALPSGDGVAIAVGAASPITAAAVRDAAAAFANATTSHGAVAFVLPAGLEAATLRAPRSRASCSPATGGMSSSPSPARRR